jgi:hypothetical protein
MPFTSVTPKLAKAINRMVAQLKLDYGDDYCYTIGARGMTLVLKGMNYGPDYPIPSVQPKTPKKKVDNLTKNSKVTP